MPRGRGRGRGGGIFRAAAKPETVAKEEEAPPVVEEPQPEVESIESVAPPADAGSETPADAESETPADAETPAEAEDYVELYPNGDSTLDQSESGLSTNQEPASEAAQASWLAGEENQNTEAVVDGDGDANAGVDGDAAAVTDEGQEETVKTDDEGDAAVGNRKERQKRRDMLFQKRRAKVPPALNGWIPTCHVLNKEVHSQVYEMSRIFMEPVSLELLAHELMADVCFAATRLTIKTNRKKEGYVQLRFDDEETRQSYAARLREAFPDMTIITPPLPPSDLSSIKTYFKDYKFLSFQENKVLTSPYTDPFFHNNTIAVYGIHEDHSEEFIMKSLKSIFGEEYEICLPKDKETGKHKGFAFIDMKTNPKVMEWVKKQYVDLTEGQRLRILKIHDDPSYESLVKAIEMINPANQVMPLTDETRQVYTHFSELCQYFMDHHDGQVAEHKMPGKPKVWTDVDKDVLKKHLFMLQGLLNISKQQEATENKVKKGLPLRDPSTGCDIQLEVAEAADGEEAGKNTHIPKINMNTTISKLHMVKGFNAQQKHGVPQPKIKSKAIDALHLPNAMRIKAERTKENQAKRLEKRQAQKNWLKTGQTEPTANGGPKPAPKPAASAGKAPSGSATAPAPAGEKKAEATLTEIPDLHIPDTKKMTQSERKYYNSNLRAIGLDPSIVNTPTHKLNPLNKANRTTKASQQHAVETQKKMLNAHIKAKQVLSKSAPHAVKKKDAGAAGGKFNQPGAGGARLGKRAADYNNTGFNKRPRQDGYGYGRNDGFSNRNRSPGRYQGDQGGYNYGRNQHGGPNPLMQSPGGSWNQGQQGMGMQQRPQQPNEEQAGALNLLVNLSKILKASGGADSLLGSQAGPAATSSYSQQAGAGAGYSQSAYDQAYGGQGSSHRQGGYGSQGSQGQGGYGSQGSQGQGRYGSGYEVDKQFYY